ncbi:MAG TPA: 30S ribosomal protein S6 [Terriglobia bacterium]|nr:30S ribosomal protein S6 [Terriglobia bacterium]
MRKYEIIFIIRPDMEEEDLNKLVTQMEGVVAGAGGKVERVDRMGRRRLAYRVGRHQDGHYVLFVLEGTGDTLKELERRLGVTDSVIKFLAVRIDEEQKRVEKLKAQRAAREAKRPKTKPASPPQQLVPAAPQQVEELPPQI